MVRQFSAGGIVYKKDHGQVLFLLRQSSLSPGYYDPGAWTLPKGWLDDAPDGINPGPLTLGQKRASEDQIQTAALREVREESGVEAKIITRIGSNKFFFVDHNHQKVLKTVIYYLMEFQRVVTSGFDSETNSVSWFTADQAGEILKKRKGESALITKAENMVNSGQMTLV